MNISFKEIQSTFSGRNTILEENNQGKNLGEKTYNFVWPFWFFLGVKLVWKLGSPTLLHIMISAD